MSMSSQLSVVSFTTANYSGVRGMVLQICLCGCAGGLVAVTLKSTGQTDSMLRPMCVRLGNVGHDAAVAADDQ